MSRKEVAQFLRRRIQSVLKKDRLTNFTRDLVAVQVNFHTPSVPEAPCTQSPEKNWLLAKPLAKTRLSESLKSRSTNRRRANQRLQPSADDAMMSRRG